MIQINQERFEKVFKEMKEERDERIPYLSGHARLIADYNLRQAVLEGAYRWEKKQHELRKRKERSK